jgi:hypothetical protein
MDSVNIAAARLEYAATNYKVLATELIVHIAMTLQASLVYFG